MRRTIILVALFVVVPFVLSAQRTVPSNYSSSVTKNYVRTWDATCPEANPNTLATKTVSDVKQATQYFDGMTRPLQTVLKHGSLVTGSSPTDMVTAVQYNDYGQEQFSYLPFSSTGTDGLFKLDPFQQQANFYGDVNGVLKGQGETWFYGETTIEASPLGRTMKQEPAGNSWVGNDKGVVIGYWNNTSTDAVRKWSVTDVSNSWGTYATSGTYSAGTLVKTITADENGNQVIEFKDKEGLVILKKVQCSTITDNGTGADYVGFLSTYYVYDELNRLRLVIQPKGVKLLVDASWSSTELNNILDGLCFRYEYDKRNRMIRKKVPDAGETWMVYDAKDRLVLTQDANMRQSSQKKWLYTKYDLYNRPISSGLITDNSYYNDLTYHLNAAYSSSDYPDLNSYSYEELSKSFYDNYLWLTTYGSPLPDTRSTAYDTYLLSASSSWPYPEAISQSKHIQGMMTGSRTKVLGTSTYLYQVMFYDEKGRPIQIQATNIIGGIDITTTQYLWTGQPVTIVSKTEKAGSGSQTTTMITQMEYDELGRLQRVNKKVANSLVNSGSMPSTFKTIVENHYDKLGQLKTKKLSPTGGSGGNPLEVMNYEYNIRGWTLGANRDYIKDVGSNWFGFELAYDKTANIISGQSYAAAQYNGNITGTTWKTKGDLQKRKYDFSYDPVNRFMNADFKQYDGTSFVDNTLIKFDVVMGDGSTPATAYDENGNILKMQQYGFKLTSSDDIDEMKYTYTEKSNKLKSVTDFSNDPLTRFGDFRTLSSHPQASSKSALNSGSSESSFQAITDYSYDQNGSMTVDYNKDITFIQYNHLNLPQLVMTGKGNIEYDYDAGGRKIRKRVTESSVSVPYNGSNYTTNITTVHTYLDALMFESKTYSNSSLSALNYDKLLYIGHEEGKIRYELATSATCTALSDRLVYDYFLRDHLGNVRMVLTEQAESQCYPMATVEDSRYQSEQNYYSIVNGRRIDKSVTGATQSSFENKLYRTQGDLSNEKTGLAIVLKVMAGDQVKISVESYHTGQGAQQLHLV